MTRDSRALRIAVAVALPCVTLIAAHALYDPLYRTNDDPAMLLMSAGHAYVEQPTPYLIYSHHVWGQLVSTLYTWLPAMPWYRILQLAVQFVAGATLLYVALGRRPSIERLVPVAGCFVVFDMLMLVRPHFTLTSSVASIAAVLLAADQTSSRHGPGRLRWVLFGLLWFAAAAIRHQSAFLIYALALPPALVSGFLLWREGDLRRALLRIGIPLLVGLTIVASLYGYNRLRYDVPEWRDFVESSPAIGDVVDFAANGFPKTETWASFPDGTGHLVEVRYAPEVYAAAAKGPGWSAAEFHMLMEWFYADRELYSSERLNSFLDQIGGTKGEWGGWLPGLWWNPLLPVMLAAIVLAFSFRQGRPGQWIGVALAILGALAALTYIDVQLNRLVSWIWEPVLALLCWLVLITGRASPFARSDRIRLAVRLVLLGVLFVLMVTSALYLDRLEDVATTKREAFNEAIPRLESGTETLYVVWAGAFPLELVGPFDDLEPFRNLHFYSVGADTRGGHNIRQLRRFGVEDIHRAIYEDPRLRVIAEPRHIRILTAFVHERYATDIKSERTAAYATPLHPLFDVYRFREIEPAE